MASVVPTLVQSSMMVFSECRSLLEQDKSIADYLKYPPNLRDVFRVIAGCAKLPRENAENKKLFTRLWVHESLRSFYDRLFVEEHREAVFQVIRTCVKTIFRENFDSAFEHLGKIDGKASDSI